MKKISTKYLLIYTITLFSAALLLILISAFQQQRASSVAKDYEQQLSAQKVFVEGAQKTLSSITDENNYLKSQLEAEQAKNQTLSAQINSMYLPENESLKTELETEKKYEKVKTDLIQAQMLYNEKKYSLAKKVLSGIDKNYATPTEIKLLNTLMSKVKNY